MSLVNGCCPTSAGALAISAGIETPVSSGTVVFGNANGITFGMIGSTITASAFITASASAGLNSLSAGTSYATGPGVLLSNAHGVSFGANGNTITASIAPQSQQSISVFSQWGDFATNFTLWPGQASFQKVSMPMGLSGSSGALIFDVLGHSNSSGAVSYTVGAYQITASTAGLLASRSASFSWGVGSDTADSGVYGGVSGTRYRPFDWDVNMSPGDYLFAVMISTENDGTIRPFGRQGVQIVGSYAGFETNYFVDGYTNSTMGTLPGVIVANNTNYIRTGLSALKQPGFILFGTN